MARETDDTKVADTLNKILKIINKSSLTIGEILLLFGNLGYNLGASIAGFEGQGPSLEELKKEYYRNPTVDTGLMLQGLLITDWEKDFLQKPALSSFAQLNREKQLSHTAEQAVNNNEEKKEK